MDTTNGDFLVNQLFSVSSILFHKQYTFYRGTKKYSLKLYDFFVQVIDIGLFL